MVNEELRECPFCGGKTDIVIADDYETHCECFVASCKNCGCRTPFCECEKNAVTCWNNRAPNERENELVKILAILVDCYDNELHFSSKRIRAMHAAKDLLKSYAD